MTQSTTDPSNKIDQQLHQKNVITFRYPGTKDIVYFSNLSTSLSLPMYEAFENEVAGKSKEEFLKFLAGLDFSNEAKRSTATSELSEADIVKSISSLFK